jgi:cytoskeleton protein RodZ
VDNGIGTTLRETRNRRKLDLSEVETAIKIRVRFLRAMENEEWDALPGDTYARGFIRTYANYLGLDGERLAEDFRAEAGREGGKPVPKRVEPVPAAFKERKPRVPARLVLVVVSLGLLGLLIGIGLAGGERGEDGGGSGDGAPASGREETTAAQRQATAPAAQPGVAINLAATAEVWVCLLDAEEEPLIEGEILEEGAEAGPFRSRRFELALGNGSVDLSLDGEPVQIEESSSPVGYEIDSDGELLALEEGERPDCE